MKKIVIFIIISLAIISSIQAETIRIITPYLGTVENDMSRTMEHDGHSFELILKDNSLFKGLYFQSINPDKYQWNAFVYNSEDLNYSSLWGTHFIFDYYLGIKENSKYVIGAGIEYLRMKTDANSLSFDTGAPPPAPPTSTINDFGLSQNIFAPYLRAGKYFYFGDKKIRYSVMPWAGFEADIIKGDIDFIVPPMGPGAPETPVGFDIDDDTFFGIAGVNFKATFYHFIDLKLKYHGKLDLDENDYYSVCSSMLNIYFSRNWGISYRAKYMKTTEMENTYHIGGIVYAF